MKYTEDREFLQFLENYKQSFSGWDFSFISDTGRVASEPLEWSYVSKAMKFIHSSKAMLDMGTGGESYYLGYALFQRSYVRQKRMHRMFLSPRKDWSHWVCAL